METKNSFYRWSKAVCDLYPEAGPIATMMVVNAACGHQAMHVNHANPVLWLTGPPASGKSTLCRLMVYAAPQHRSEFMGRADWRHRLETHLRLDSSLVFLHEFQPLRFEGVLEKDLFSNMIAIVYARIRYSRIVDEGRYLYVDTKGDRSCLVMESSDKADYLPMVMSRSIVLELNREPITPHLQERYHRAMATVVEQHREPASYLSGLVLKVSEYARTAADRRFTAYRETATNNPRVLNNYITLMALYNMLPEDLVPFRADELFACLTAAMDKQLGVMEMN